MTESSKYARLIVMLYAAFIGMNGPLYLAIDKQIFPAPYYWLGLLALLSTPALIKRCASWDMLRSPLVLWCFGFLWVSIAGFFVSAQTPALWRETLLRIMVIFELIWFYILLTDVGVMKLARYGLLAATAINVALNIYEFFYPLTWSITYGRSAGLHGNPNQSADAIAMGTLLTVSVLPLWARMPYLLFAGIGVLTTFSRSGIVEWCILAIGAVVMQQVRGRDFLLIGGACLFVGFLLFIPFGDDILKSWDKMSGANRDLLERLNFFGTPTEVIDYSALERAYVAQQAWERVADHPLLGHGTGAASDVLVGTHNAYLEFMEDHGVFGMLLLPLLVLAATWGAAGEVRQVAWIFAFMVLWQGFFSHGLLYVDIRVFVLALMAAMVWYNQEAKFKWEEEDRQAQRGSLAEA